MKGPPTVSTTTDTTPVESDEHHHPEPTPPENHTPLRRQILGRYTGPCDIDGQLRMCAELAKARFALPYRYRDNPADLYALVQHAVALDISLPVAWDNLHFSPEGVGGMRARLMHALVIRAGHTIVPLHTDELQVRMRLVRGDGKPGSAAKWTRYEAVRARLLSKDKSPWVPYPEDMLWARCLSRVVRRGAPEVVMGFYVLEDLDDLPADDVLDSVDLSTAMTDVDGNLVPAPDIMELMKDLDAVTDPDEVRRRGRIATEEGKAGAYAGMLDGVPHTLGELLYGRLMLLTGGSDPDLTVVPLLTGDAATPARADTPAPGSGSSDADDAPAGTGAALSCGCNPATVLSAGAHEDTCDARG